MQVPRHWRMRQQRYRLEGFVHSNGEVTLQPRPLAEEQTEQRTSETRDDVTADNTRDVRIA